MTELIVYRNILKDEIVASAVSLFEENTLSQGEKQELLHDISHSLTNYAVKYGLCGNLWQSYLTYLLITEENAYTLSCEGKDAPTGTLSEIALCDFAVIKELFDLDFAKVACEREKKILSLVFGYQQEENPKAFLSPLTVSKINTLSQELSSASNVATFQKKTEEFYKTNGVGKFGLHKAFRIMGSEGATQILPIAKIPNIRLSDLVGLERQKEQIVRNTQAFVEGKGANNCLLFGDAGTGKSTCVKGVLNQFAPQGLRIIEVYKHQFINLADVIAQIKNRNYKFIIYMDDLSFEEFEIEYKYLKAIIEGGLEKTPENLLIYATSNRRNLIREEQADRAFMREDINTNDTMQEKLSLSSRFGEYIYFASPSQKEYHEIVRELAKKHGIEMDEEDMLTKASTFELRHGGKSGRSAQQFIDYLLSGM